MHVFGGMKKIVQLKLVQLLLLNREKARWSKNRAAQGFYYINSFRSNIFGPYSRSVQLEAVYLEALLYTMEGDFVEGAFLLSCTGIVMLYSWRSLLQNYKDTKLAKKTYKNAVEKMRLPL